MNGVGSTLIKELSDVFIISTCLANQYCANLDEELINIGYSRNIHELYDSTSEYHDITEAFLDMSIQASKFQEF